MCTDVAQRGLDFPKVDWIVQFDPPQWSDQFVHRIGRTARAGRSGQSLLFLTESEEPYLAYLKAKNVEIVPHEITGTAEPRSVIQKAMLEDRELIDKSQEAFVSFLRYYKEH